MKVSKAYLEQRVEELQCWLDHHAKADAGRKLREQNRRYYLRKLAVADEQDMDFIEI